MDVVAIEHLVKQTVTYALQRGNHSFSLTSDEMKSFIDKKLYLTPDIQRFETSTCMCIL